MMHSLCLTLNVATKLPLPSSGAQGLPSDIVERQMTKRSKFDGQGLNGPIPPHAPDQFQKITPNTAASAPMMSTNRIAMVAPALPA
jgi:hypothetical protein